MSRALFSSRRVELAALGVALAGLALGATPVAAAAARPPAASRIQHVVILMQENRSFDDYLGRLHFEGQTATAPEPPGANNPNPTNLEGPPIRALHQAAYCEVADLNHSWTGVHQEIDGGRMDGFTAANVDPADP